MKKCNCRRKILKHRLGIAAATILAVLALLAPKCLAAVEIGENHVMFDLCQYDGNSSLPYGWGSAGAYCYYPRSDNSEYLFPEVYTWNGAAISETADGAVRLRAESDRIGQQFSLCFDKVPDIYRQSVQKHLGFFVVRLKSEISGDAVFTFSSPGNDYRKSISVSLNGEWQNVVLNLSEADGWTRKQSDGTYEKMTTSPWSSGAFGGSGFILVFPSLGENVRATYYVDYIAYTTEPEAVIDTGAVKLRNAYIFGDENGLFNVTDYLTRAQACAIVSRLAIGSDNVPNADSEFEGRFSDVAIGAWYYDYAAYLESLGCLDAYGEEFSPEKPITSAELAAYIVVAGLYDADNYKIPDFYENTALLSAVTESERAFGTSGGKELTRAQACALINHLTGRNKATSDIEYEEELFSDVAKSIWCYADILNAALSCNVRISDDGTEQILSFVPEPDYKASSEKIAEIDSCAAELYESIHNSPNTVSNVYGTVYYVSPSGSDGNSGTSKSSPWKTLGKVNAVGMGAGTTVMFERGGVWRGQLKAQNGVTYTAYGEGAKPAIYGSPYDGADPELWTLVEGTDNVWKFAYNMLDCGSVVFNHGQAHSDKETPSYKDGVYYHRNSTKVFDYKTDISENLGIFCDNKNNLEGECPLYLRSDLGNPGELFDSIEFMPRQNIINVVASDKGAVIDNLSLKYGGAHGVGAGTVSQLYVRNCEFMWIGGSIQSYGTAGGTMPVRYGNAVEVYGGCDGYYVENNYIHQVYDAGITHQLSGGTQTNGIQKNIRYSGNLIEFCSYSVEYFLRPDANGTFERYMENVVIEENIMRFAGFGFGNQRTDRLCMSHIKSGSGDNAVSQGFYIRNNVFDRSREMLINVGAGLEEDLPLFEGNVYIQYETLPETPFSTLGIYGVSPGRLRFFSKDAKSTIRRIGLEDNPEIYFAEKDGLYELAEY